MQINVLFATAIALEFYYKMVTILWILYIILIHFESEIVDCIIFVFIL